MHLSVDTELARVKDVIKSGLLKQLRQFREVEIEEEIKLSIGAIFIEAMEVPWGYVISAVYTERSLSSEILNSDWTTQDRSQEDLVFMGQTLHSCSEAKLGQTLDNIVASIDSHIIEPTRQVYQRANKEEK